MAEDPPATLDGATLTRRLLACAAIACLFLAALLNLSWPELRRSGIIAQPLAALIVLLAALIGTAQLTRARPALIGAGRAARLPQVLLVPALAVPAAALAWLYRPALAAPACLPQQGYLLGGCAIALAFLLLIAERALAQTPPRTLPEAPDLRALAFVATGTAFLTGAFEILANLGLPAIAGRLGEALAVLIAAIAIELATRAALRVFLPPPPQDAATAATHSAIARLLSAGAGGPGGIAPPLRQHLGIDFSRSWALAYVRGAILPMAAFLGLLAWGLTGVTLVPIDGRAVYERFGAPTAVLHSGLHAGLPWPLGTTRPVEYGAVHEIGLEPRPADATPAGAEDPEPTSADRLWKSPHPGEITLVIASDTKVHQSFQSVSADLRVLYRTGLTDADARQAAYAIEAPEALVRALAGRVVAQYFAVRTLDAVLGANREAMAETLRARLQSALDQHAVGMEAVAIVIEAIHPPAGAADAYHNVRAAEIAARTSVAVEHGAAATIAAQSRQYAYDMTSAAHATAAESVAHARANLVRFDADRAAARAGGQSFLLERYFSALSAALARAPKTIIDHRLNWPEAPVLDLRPYSAAAGAATGKEE
jgi:regulator of protease activity HflC (stomatin/prohibitin superfamily)